MKKFAIALLATAGLAVGGLGVAGIAEAQVGEQTPLIQAEADTDNEGDGERDGRRGRRGHRGAKLSLAAEVIGIEQDELRAALEAGDSIADVAAANGVSADEVIAAIVDRMSERLAEKVESGRLTQAEADEKLAAKTLKIENRVNGIDDAPDA